MEGGEEGSSLDPCFALGALPCPPEGKEADLTHAVAAPSGPIPRLSCPRQSGPRDGASKAGPAVAAGPGVQPGDPNNPGFPGWPGVGEPPELGSRTRPLYAFSKPSSDTWFSNTPRASPPRGRCSTRGPPDQLVEQSAGLLGCFVCGRLLGRRPGPALGLRRRWEWLVFRVH